MKKAILLGIVSSFFFAFTFVLNRSMNLGGGFWMWSAVLRYLFTCVLLLPFVLPKGRAKAALGAVKEQPIPWLLWSTVGFGLFYLPLTCASLFAESWFTAAVWQITIAAGVLLTPLFGRKLPVKNLLWSLVILLGIAVMQIPKLSEGLGGGALKAFALILPAAFAYPLGNRKVMALCGGKLDTVQRVFAMTLCSLPFWIVCGVIAAVSAGLPSAGQILQSLGVALFSGVAATLLFFRATDLTRDDARGLAVTEATQSGEVLFTLLLGILVLHDAAPSPAGWAGLALIVVGMICNALAR